MQVKRQKKGRACQKHVLPTNGKLITTVKYLFWKPLKRPPIDKCKCTCRFVCCHSSPSTSIHPAMLLHRAKLFRRDMMERSTKTPYIRFSAQSTRMAQNPRRAAAMYSINNALINWSQNRHLLLVSTGVASCVRITTTTPSHDVEKGETWGFFCECWHGYVACRHDDD